MSDENVLTAEIQHPAVPARNIRLAACSVTLLLSCFLLGCGGDNDEDLETIPGLQEENRVLREKIGNLEDEIKGFKAKIKALETQADDDVADLIKSYEDQLTKQSELHRQKVAQLDSDISSLQFELGPVQRENLTLREIVDQRPNIQESKKKHLIGLIVVLSFLLLLVICLLVFVVFRYRVARERLSIFMTQQTAEMSLWRVGDE